MRTPPSTLARAAAAAVGGIALVIVYMIVAVFKAAFPPVVVFAVLAVVSAGVALVARRWAPVVPAVYALAFQGMTLPFFSYELTRLDSPAFGPVVVLMALSLLALACGVGAALQNYRLAPEARRVPAWLVPGTGALAGACLAALAIAALPQQASAGVSKEALASLPAVHLKNFEFGEKEIRVKAGAQVALNVVNADNMPHQFDIDAVGVHAPVPASGSALALFRAPTTPGRYVVYCTPHYDKGHHEGMQAVLVVE